MYTTGIYITDPIGNNEFHYNERIALGSQGKIFVPNLIQGNLDNLELGSEIVFEEAEFTESRNDEIENSTLRSCTGLKHFVQLNYQGIPTYIVDNHNHALSFRYQQTQSFKNNNEAKPFIVIHIDQHADTKPNNEIIRGNIEHFVHEKTNVGNFISAARNNTIIDEVIQIRSEYALHHIQELKFLEYNYIIDIDIDFWEGKTDKEIQVDISIIKTLIKNACLITIATSPYFIDQKRALEIIHMILQ